MATSIWDVATEGASAFDIVGGYMSDVELSYEDRAAIDVATESDTGFVDYINECQMALLDSQNRAFAQESVAAIQFAKGMDIATAMEGLKNTIRNAWEAIKEFLQKIWETIKEYVKKAKDWLARRASLGKALITKYSSVLRNKNVSESLQFDWCEINIKAFTGQRSNWMAKILPAYSGSAATTVAAYNQSFQTIKKKQNEIAEENKKDQPDDSTINAATKVINDELEKLRKSGLSSQNGAEYYSTQDIAEEMRKKLYGDNNPNGPKYDKKTWSEIKDDVMAWADMDPSRYLTEALGIFEKDSNAMMKIIKEQQKNMEDALDDEKKNSAIDKKVESGIRAVIRRCAAGGAKVHKMYITHLKEAISLMQTQAIAAARKAILDKGTTTNESYIFNDMDVIY